MGYSFDTVCGTKHKVCKDHFSSACEKVPHVNCYVKYVYEIEDGMMLKPLQGKIEKICGSTLSFPKSKIVENEVSHVHHCGV